MHQFRHRHFPVAFEHRARHMLRAAHVSSTVTQIGNKYSENMTLASSEVSSALPLTLPTHASTTVTQIGNKYSENMTPASSKVSSALHEFRQDLVGYCHFGWSRVGERKINFGNGQFSTTSLEEKCSFNKIIAYNWTRLCYFVGIVALNIVVLFGAGTATKRAFSMAFMIIQNR